MNKSDTRLEAARDTFVARHIGPSDRDVEDMLRALQVASLDELMKQTVPESIRQPNKLEIGPALSEVQAIERLSVNRLANLTPFARRGLLVALVSSELAGVAE